MIKGEKATRDRIHEIATSEFLDKGFRDASLRNIVKEAGVTTGSFYWYYSSKEELYDALVGEHYNHILQMYDDALETFWKMSKEEQKEHMGDIGGECMAAMVEYMYQHLTEFRLLLTASSGTKYENLLHELTHYKRHDIAFKALVLWVCALHWFNPAVWLMRRAVERDLELACDDAALRVLPEDERAAYGNTVLQAATGKKGVVSDA